MVVVAGTAAARLAAGADFQEAADLLVAAFAAEATGADFAETMAVIATAS